MAEIIRILIADDFQLLREDMSEFINRQPDMEVVGMAASGKDIVALAKQIPYDLILMDIASWIVLSIIFSSCCFHDSLDFLFSCSYFP